MYLNDTFIKNEIEEEGECIEDLVEINVRFYCDSGLKYEKLFSKRNLIIKNIQNAFS